MVHNIRSKYDYIVLVLQGGGSLGAYQAGVFEGLTEAGYTPNWVTGVSIGAINAALIAGNPVGHRIEKLREFWNLVSSGLPVNMPAFLDPFQYIFNRASITISSLMGVPGFYSPRMLSPLLASDGDPNALSFYDTQPLKATLERLVNFDLINQRETTRFSVGAVNIRNGNSTYFDNQETKIEIPHVMASCALPPAFGPVEINGEHYWDGGIVSNTPLWYVLDNSPHLKGLVVQVDLFNARGDMPQNLDQVMERQKDIMYSSKTRFNTTHVIELEEMAKTLQRVLKKIPKELKDDPDVKMLQASNRNPQHIDIMHLINRRRSYTSPCKDNEFSRMTIDQLWEAGLDDVRRSFAHPEWLNASKLTDGIHVFDLTR